MPGRAVTLPLLLAAMAATTQGKNVQRNGRGITLPSGKHMAPTPGYQNRSLQNVPSVGYCGVFQTPEEITLSSLQSELSQLERELNEAEQHEQDVVQQEREAQERVNSFNKIEREWETAKSARFEAGQKVNTAQREYDESRTWANWYSGRQAEKKTNLDNAKEAERAAMKVEARAFKKWVNSGGPEAQRELNQLHTARYDAGQQKVALETKVNVARYNVRAAEPAARAGRQRREASRQECSDVAYEHLTSSAALGTAALLGLVGTAAAAKKGRNKYTAYYTHKSAEELKQEALQKRKQRNEVAQHLGVQQQQQHQFQQAPRHNTQQRGVYKGRGYTKRALKLKKGETRKH